MDKAGAISDHKICKIIIIIKKKNRKFILQNIKMSNPKEIQTLKRIENLETVIERHQKVIEKLEIN